MDRSSRSLMFGCSFALNQTDLLGKTHSYRLTNICAFKLPATDPVVTFGDTPLDRLTLEHIEAFRDARKAAGLSAVAVNHDLKLLRSMFNWGIRRGTSRAHHLESARSRRCRWSARFRGIDALKVQTTRRDSWLRLRPIRSCAR
jgi:hypothetical protein